MKNLNFSERYMMGIWFEITALAILLSISINLQRMYLLMRNKIKNAGVELVEMEEGPFLGKV